MRAKQKHLPLVSAEASGVPCGTVPRMLESPRCLEWDGMAWRGVGEPGSIAECAAKCLL